MKLKSQIFAVLASVALTAQASAHFVWVITVTDSTGKELPHVVFGEGPEPGEEFLLDKVAQTKAWVQLPEQEPKALALAKQAGKETGSWVGDASPNGAAVFATCDYGVLEKNGKTFLLQYYAKKLDASPEQLKSLARTETLPLDLVPALEADSGSVRVLWRGKRVSGGEVTVTAPDGNSQKHTTDDQGVVTFKRQGSGTYSFRAKHVVQEAGQRNGKSYASQSHYSTLVLNVPEAAK